MKTGIFASIALALSLQVKSRADAATVAYRASILDFVQDPYKATEPSYRYFPDGLLVVTDGHVASFGPYTELHKQLPGKTPVKDYRGKLIMPGFIDTHIHYPQTEMVASYGEQLLEWLNTYTFPTERKYGDAQYAAERAEFFVNELLRNGTTSALVFGTVHPESVDALFTAAKGKNLRMIAGKVLMDRNAPDFLLDTPQKAYDESEALIKKWHRNGRLLYAITPRFAPTSTPEQLQKAGDLKEKYPDVYVHTHLSENKNEVAWVKSLFPERKNYLDVYSHYGLTGDRSVFAHAIHLEDDEVKQLADSQSVVSFCPTSNLFLGSGLFRMHDLKDRSIRIGMGTDIGAGTSFSMLATLNEAYKVMQLQGQKLPALESLYQATLGSARALKIDDSVGNFQEGKEADFIVIDLSATPLQALRQSHAQTLEDKLFALTIMGDDRNIAATYVMGRAVYTKR